jgi:dGTP triphosphohydrolase
MPLLLIALLAGGSAFGAKKYWDSKHPKFFFWADRGMTEEEKGAYAQMLYLSDDITSLKTAMHDAFSKGYLQTGELLGEKILAIAAKDGQTIALVSPTGQKWNSVLDLVNSPDSF